MRDGLVPPAGFGATARRLGRSRGTAARGSTDTAVPAKRTSCSPIERPSTATHAERWK
jgi:hypothetical protein